MPKFIKWTGRNVRNNSYGSFAPNKVVEVPNHVAAELLTVPLFKEASMSEAASINATETDLRVTVTNLTRENEHLVAENERLHTDLTAAQEAFTHPEEAEVFDDEVIEDNNDEPVETGKIDDGIAETA